MHIYYAVVYLLDRGKKIASDDFDRFVYSVIRIYCNHFSLIVYRNGVCVWAREKNKSILKTKEEKKRVKKPGETVL